MDIKYFLSYFLKDENWLKKYIVGCLLIVPNVLATLCNPALRFMKYAVAVKWVDLNTASYLMIAFSAVSILCSIFISGYIGVNANLRTYKKDSSLPSWLNLKSILSAGLKMATASLIYLILMIIPFIFLVFINTTICSFFVQGTFWDVLPSAIKVSNFITMIIWGSLLLTSLLAFSTDLRFKSFFNYKLIENIIKNNTKKYFIYLLYCVIVSIFFALVNYISFYKFAALAIVIPFLYFYFSLVFPEVLAFVLRPLE